MNSVRTQVTWDLLKFKVFYGYFTGILRYFTIFYGTVIDSVCGKFACSDAQHEETWNQNLVQAEAKSHPMGWHMDRIVESRVTNYISTEVMSVSQIFGRGFSRGAIFGYTEHRASICGISHCY